MTLQLATPPPPQRSSGGSGGGQLGMPVSNNMRAINFVAGLVGGGWFQIVAHPFDTVRARMQTCQLTYSSPLHCVADIHNRDGVLGFFRGLGAPMVGVGLGRMALFVTYSELNKYFLGKRKKEWEEIQRQRLLELEARRRQEQATLSGQIRLAWSHLLEIGTIFAPPATESVLLAREAEDAHSLSAYLQNNGHLDFWEVVTCAVVGGVAFSTVMTPFEVVKLRLITEDMYSHRKYNGSIDCARQLVSQKGWVSLYRGYSATLLRDAPAATIFFGGYGNLRRYLPQSCPSTTFASTLVAGGLAGGLSFWLTFPLDTIKTRIQTSREHRSWIETARVVYQSRGVVGFYRGGSAGFLRAAVGNAVSIAAVESCLKSASLLGLG